MTLVGERFTVDVGPVAHGGHCVARHDGRVVFVRHALPGERVVATVTEGEDDSRFLRADATEVLQAAPGRVKPRCPVSGPGGCGGCDFQHVDLPTQRELLGAVVAEQLQRLAGLDVDVRVEAPDDGDGLGWRTRVGYAVGDGDRLGLRRHRSHDVLPVDPCPIAHPALADLTSLPWPAVRVEGVVSSTGERLAVVEGARGELPPVPLDGVVDERGRHVSGASQVVEQVRHRSFTVGGSGFWQVHPRAAGVLVDAVMDAARPEPGQTVADLYAGVGLFAAFLAEAVGESGLVVAVESGRRATEDAAANLADLPQAVVAHAGVQPAMDHGTVPPEVDVVVLDPPRTGAKAKVVRAIASRRPERVVYVACDPAALARDVATFAEEGYVLDALRAFALFPMTHHVECVATLVPAPAE
ncbi:class I SAM-dependent RNA methyltransferase [Solicola sp. PLA-1-18]|uniref:class I SAM-dependent RNA methyltransferase n=1 Tax=Solicola sp. PLA-1-18 TaxID=3380532 RepID=UPI003B7D82F8